MSGWAQRDAERQEEEREALAELEPENARLQAENDLLRALLWAALNPTSTSRPTVRKRGVAGIFLTFFWESCHGGWNPGTPLKIGDDDIDTSLIPAPVAARLVAAWREATK